MGEITKRVNCGLVAYVYDALTRAYLMVIVGGFDGSPDAVEAIKAGELAYTVLQPVATFSAEAVHQADRYLKTGEKPATEKQLFDCLLITPDNVDNYTAPFVLEQ